MLFVSVHDVDKNKYATVLLFMDFFKNKKCISDNIISLFFLYHNTVLLLGSDHGQMIIDLHVVIPISLYPVIKTALNYCEKYMCDTICF